jgi:type I restriction enzyme M protein
MAGLKSYNPKVSLSTLSEQLKSSFKMTKEQERDELHRAIWQIANDLRGSVDGWDFKSYVLGMLFYRFISENLTSYINKEEQRTGNKNFDYTKISDKDAEFGRADTVKEKGFYILPSELFVNVWYKAKNDANLNETLSKVFKNIENSAKGTDSEDDLRGLFDDIDVNSNKLGATVQKRNETLVKIIDSIGGLELGDYQDNTNDLFGDAYEFLMTMYASNAGKSGGEFFTPQEVSELLAEITVVGKKQVNKVYDPACGSGSLLLKFAKVLGKENVRQGFYGQEVNITTYNLCRINMFLHDINYEKFDIAHGDTLTEPKHWDDEPFDCIVSNPPYSIKWEGDANPLLINDPRFSPAGVLAPKSKADLAFTMHMLSWLSTSGTAAIVEFPGVLYRSGAEQKIRKYLIDNNYVDAVIQLPPDLFFGTGIATCVIVLKKSKKDNATLFIDASAEFVRGGNKNKLTEPNRKKILNAFVERKDIDHFARLVPNSDIAENDYNIAVSSYVEQENTTEEVNIEKLNAHIAEIVIRQNKLRTAIDAIVADLEGGTI